MAEQKISRFDSQRLINNRELRIFLSSTFTDMQQERKALIKTFQTLKIESIKRNVTLSVLDLRWGVTDEEACTGKVLSVCLEEIEHSHPFFIGLLGNCYGSSPDISVLEINPELKERYPWVCEDIKNGLSYTEIEMQYGALRNDHDVDALFFIKNTDDIVADDNEKLTRLKQQIHEQNRFPKSEYTSIDDLCGQVKSSVLAILDKHFPEKESTRLEHERTVQKAYINNRYGHYQKPIADFNRLDNFLNSDETHLVISGPSGMGKSALIANWLKEKQATLQSHNIIYHFVGNSFSGSDHTQILQHICDELYSLYNIERHEGLSEKLEDEVQRILIEAGQKGKPILIVIDGINQIADHNHSKLLNWLPQAPHFAKYLFSTLDNDETMEIFKRREYPVHQIGTLDRASRREFIINYLSYVGKKLTDEQIDRILNDPENKNMLVLKTLLDELICFGVRKQLDQRIDYYLSSSSIDDFFDRMLQRMEEDYEEVPRILSLIALSENGMTEDELQAITKLRPLDIHLFYCAFYNHFVTRDGLITFGHQYVAEAIWKRYGLEDPEKGHPSRQQIIDYVSNSDNVSRNRQISELAFQYYHTGDDEDLYKTILSFEAFRYFNASDKGNATLALYWRQLLENNPEKYHLNDYLELPTDGIPATNIPYFAIAEYVFYYFGEYDVSGNYNRKALTLSIDNKSHNTDFATYYNNFGVINEHQGAYSEALNFHSKALEIREKVLKPGHNHIAMSHMNIGAVHEKLGNYNKALEHFFKALEIQKKAIDKDFHILAGSYNSIGAVHYSLGDYTKALEYFFKALEIRENIMGAQHPDTANSYNNIGVAYDCLGEYSKSLEYYFKALEIRERILGTEHPDTAITYFNLGENYNRLTIFEKSLEYYFKALEVYSKVFIKDNDLIAKLYNSLGNTYCDLGEYTKALDYHLKSLRIFENLMGPEHPDTSTCYNSLGILYSNLGEYSKALEYLLKALKIVKTAFGEHHPDMYSLYLNIGLAYNHLGEYKVSLDYFFNALIIGTEVLGPNDPSISTCYNNIGLAYHHLEEYDNAIKYYLKSLDIREMTVGVDSIDTAVCYNNIGSVYNSKGYYNKALEYHFKALNIYQNKLGERHPSTASAYNNIGLVYRNLEDYTKALDYYHKAITIREIVLGCHPETAISYNNIGIVYKHLKDYPKALEYYYKALEIHEKVFGKEHLKTAVTYKLIGSAYFCNSEYPLALTFFHKALAIRIKELGPNHKNTQTVQQNIIMCKMLMDLRGQ